MNNVWEQRFLSNWRGRFAIFVSQNRCIIKSVWYRVDPAKKAKVRKSIEKKHQIHRNITLQQEHFMYGRKNSRRSCNYQQSNRLFETNLPLSIANHWNAKCFVIFSEKYMSLSMEPKDKVHPNFALNCFA